MISTPIAKHQGFYDHLRINVTSISGRKIVLTTAILLAISGFIYLAVGASQQPFSNLDLQIADWIKKIEVTGLSTIFGIANILTGAIGSIPLLFLAVIFFLLKDRPLEAIVILGVSTFWAGDQIIRIIVSRPAPPLELIPILDFSRVGSFPSGHITAAVTFYGLLSFLTFMNISKGYLRVVVPVISVLVIGLASIARVYVSDHWPTDVLGSYLWGGVGVIIFGWLYTSIKGDRFHIPIPRRMKSKVSKDGVKLARSIASIVFMNETTGTAIKKYKPPLLVRAIYWLAFQAPFPYQHNKAAMMAALAKRKISGLLTRYRFGQDMVAPITGIRREGDSYQFISKFIKGNSPNSNDEVKYMLNNLYAYFQEVGLPTWQISPNNPHAYSNFIRSPGGDLKLIDLESALISFSAPWKQICAFLRDAHFPIFDDVDFNRLRHYIKNHTLDLAKSLGQAGFRELQQAVNDAQQFDSVWKENELRIWGRLVRRVFQILTMGRFIVELRRKLVNSEVQAKAFIMTGIERWENDGLIDERRANSLRSSLSTSELTIILKHLGAHILISTVLIIPIPGLRSSIRFFWTLAFRLKALHNYNSGRLTLEEYQMARSIHSVPVMLIAPIPGFGAIAYAACDAITIKGFGRLLVDQVAYKLPFNLYRRLRLFRITTLKFTKSELKCPFCHQIVASNKLEITNRIQ